jgi:hypothetical protein
MVLRCALDGETNACGKEDNEVKKKRAIPELSPKLVKVKEQNIDAVGRLRMS